MNSNYDNMDDQDIKPPKRMPNTEWDKYESDKRKVKKWKA